MHGNIFSPEYMLSNIIAVLLLILAVKKPLITRALMSLIFIGAGSAFPCTVLLAITCIVLIFDAGHESLPDALRRKYFKGAAYHGKYR